MQQPIAVLYEHPEWFKPLFAELARRGVPYVALHAARARVRPRRAREPLQPGRQSDEPIGLDAGPARGDLPHPAAAEKARLDEIERLQSELRPGETPSRQVLSDLADAYLAGSSRDELARGALVLLALIQLEPENQDARARIITAYLRAGDYENATNATDAFETVAPESVDVAFFRGLIALRGTGDRTAAVEAFDEFLRTAPEDPRASMVRAFRAEAAGELPPGS